MNSSKGVHLIIIDEKNAVIKIQNNGLEEEIKFSDPYAFDLISKFWLRIGWDTKYVYSFSWLGRPIIQLPEDMIRIQEVIYRIRPNIIIETGIAHGGSIIFYASLLKVMGISGKVIGIDIDIREHNLEALKRHELKNYFELIQGSSIDPKILYEASSHIPDNSTVMVILDSNHTKEHVLSELELYSKLITKGSYIVATDGVMKDLPDAPRSNRDWDLNNPFEAVKEFLKNRNDFILEQPRWPFNESNGLVNNVTYWPGAYLKKV